MPLASSGASAASTAFDELAIPPATAAGWELSDDFEGLACSQGLMTIAGFGSLLSETSARSTFPELQCECAMPTHAPTHPPQPAAQAAARLAGTSAEAHKQHTSST